VKTLDQWLASFNESKIDLGLERVKAVLSRAPFNQISAQIVTVGGTNGKGSTVTATASLLQAAGYRVGVFTSPHIFRYNERIQINGHVQSDEVIASAFETINDVRTDIPLSYFEFSLLAALFIFNQQQVDYMVLEVGLGGRLDAVNALDSDISIITTVDIDHSDWLGDNIEAIAAEKSAIMRSGCILVYGDKNCPKAISDRADKEHVTLMQWHRDFTIKSAPQQFSYYSEQGQFDALPPLHVQTEFQLRNFASALTAVLNLLPELTHETVKTAIKRWRMPGRIQQIQKQPEVVVDVAHNRQSVEALSDYLAEHPVTGHTRAVFSVLKDKQAETWLPMINQYIDHWFVFALNHPRAIDMDTLKQQLADAQALLSVCHHGEQAFQYVMNLSQPNDRILVFGSFHVLDEVFHSAQSLLDF
jgi:folylpolyglutamate synthase/dihydrofolate synthase